MGNAREGVKEGFISRGWERESWRRRARFSGESSSGREGAKFKVMRNLGEKEAGENAFERGHVGMGDE